MANLKRRAFLRGSLFASSLWLSSMLHKSEAAEPFLSNTPAQQPKSSKNPVGPLTTFNVSDVDVAKRPLPTVPGNSAIDTMLQSLTEQQTPGIEASSHYSEESQLVANIQFHPFVAALHKAYADHRPLSLSPDMIWLLISQGLANHINANAEQLRDQFVAHEGKVPLQVQRNEFVKGDCNNDWESVFGEFSKKIRDHIGDDTHNLFLPTFSTTGIIEQAAAEIVLMDAMQSYFSYEVYTSCGIPQIELEGTVDDWQVLLNRTKDLAQFDLQWWVESLIPILEQFVAAAEGRPDQNFWQSMYKWNEVGSGTPYITGWIAAFFPYLKDPKTGSPTRPNSFLTRNDTQQQEFLYPPNHGHCPWGSDYGLTTDQFPTGLAKAPFKWFYYNTVYEMDFLAGFVGIKQDTADLTLRPEIGWIVRETVTEQS